MSSYEISADYTHPGDHFWLPLVFHADIEIDGDETPVTITAVTSEEGANAGHDWLTSPDPILASIAMLAKQQMERDETFIEEMREKAGIFWRVPWSRDTPYDGHWVEG